MMAVRNPECPICQETFKDGRGLSGHLQFKHDLSGDEHQKKLDEGMDRGRKQEQPAPPEAGGNTGRSMRDRELELKGMLYEVEEEIEEIDGFFGPSSENEDRLRDLKDRKKEIEQELSRIGSSKMEKKEGEGEGDESGLFVWE